MISYRKAICKTLGHQSTNIGNGRGGYLHQCLYCGHLSGNLSISSEVKLKELIKELIKRRYKEGVFHGQEGGEVRISFSNCLWWYEGKNVGFGLLTPEVWNKLR